MPGHPGLGIVWVDRGGGEPGVTNRLLAAVRDIVEVAPDAAFGAAELRQISAVRRHLREVHGVPPDRMSMTGYWRREPDS
jgi:NADPH-dependent ferric siderophore reductase